MFVSINGYFVILAKSQVIISYCISWKKKKNLDETNASLHLVGRAARHPDPTSCKQTDHESEVESSLMNGRVLCLHIHQLCWSKVISVCILEAFVMLVFWTMSLGIHLNMIVVFLQWSVSKVVCWLTKTIGLYWRVVET